MAATVMTVFGTIQHYSSFEENSEACLCSSWTDKKLSEHNVNYDILV